MGILNPFFQKHKYWLWKILFSLNVGIGISYFALWFVAAQQDLQWRADFTANYTGAAMVRDGWGKRLYDFEMQRHYQQQILLEEEKIADQLLPYISPPHLAVILLPLSYFKLSTAFALWTFGTLGCMIWLIRLIQGLTLDWPPIERYLFISVFLAFPPMMRTILLGTTSLLVLGFMFQTYRALRHNRPMRAGMWVACGTLRPQAIIPLALMALFQHRLRMLIGALLMGAIIIGLTASISGWQVWLDFIATLWHSGQHFNRFGVHPSIMYNLKGTLALWFEPNHASLINFLSLAGFLFAISAIIWLWCNPCRNCSSVFDLKLALAILLGLLFSPHLNPHDGLLMLLPLFLILNYLFLEDLPREKAISVISGFPIFILVSEYILHHIVPVRGPVLIMVGLITWIVFALHKAPLDIAPKQPGNTIDSVSIG